MLLAVAVVLILAGGAVGEWRKDGASAARIYFTSGGAVDRVDLAGGHRQVIVPARRDSPSVGGMALLGDGSLVVALNGRLVHFDARGRRLGDLGAGVLPAVSPDGKRLAFSVLDPNGGSSGVWLMRSDGARRRQVTRGAFDTAPAWSPDGTQILFTRFVLGGALPASARSWLETTSVTGGSPRRLTTSGSDRGGHYSADGRWIVFVSGRDHAGKVCGEDSCRYVTRLYLMRADGSDQHQVSSDPVGDGLPVFASPTTIVYSRADASSVPRSELYRSELDGSCRARITRDALDDMLPTVSGSNGAGGCVPTAPLGALPLGPNLDVANSTLTLRAARVFKSEALYWMGQTSRRFVLTNLTLNMIRPLGRGPWPLVAVVYGCSPDVTACGTSASLIQTPVCSRPTFPATARGAIDSIRGVPRVRYADRDELLTGRVIVTVYASRRDREQIEHDLRPLNPLAGRAGPGDPLPAPPHGILKGLPCQPPATSGAIAPPP